MKQTIDMLQESFRELNNDLARIVKITEQRPELKDQCRATLLALGEALKHVHGQIRAIEEASSDQQGVQT